VNGRNRAHLGQPDQRGGNLAGDEICRSHVKSVHLSYGVASTGCGSGRDDAVDFRKILSREHNVRGAHILLKVLARFGTGYRDDIDSRTLALGHGPGDGELGERGVLAARNGLERRAQPLVLLVGRRPPLLSAVF
jgi:hypothetical protein